MKQTKAHEKREPKALERKETRKGPEKAETPAKMQRYFQKAVRNTMR